MSSLSFHLFFWQLPGHIADEITRCLARSWNEITQDPKEDERKSLIKHWHDKVATSHEDVEELAGQDISDQNPAGVGSSTLQVWHKLKGGGEVTQACQVAPQ